MPEVLVLDMLLDDEEMVLVQPEHYVALETIFYESAISNVKPYCSLFSSISFMLTNNTART